MTGEEYIGAVQKLKPDIVIGLADLVVGQAPGVKRRMKMVDRTHAFTMDATEELYGEGVAEDKRSRAAYFAPVLPLENTQQSLYLEELEDELRPYISGLALYEAASLSIVPESLGELPRLLLSAPVTPQDVLREVSLGADLLTIPFMGEGSDAGMALTFAFPAPSPETAEPQPLAMDLWSSTFTTDTRPLVDGCQCYTCQNHHRAYINHLLSVKEMLAWTLLQLHNYHIMDLFFSGIRESIQNGTFESAVQGFERAYESKLPEKTGEGPRYVIYGLSLGVEANRVDSAGIISHRQGRISRNAIPGNMAVWMMQRRNTLSRPRPSLRRMLARMNSRNTGLRRRLVFSPITGVKVTI